MRVLDHKPILVDFHHPKDIKVVFRYSLEEDVIFGMVIVGRDTINIEESDAHYVSVVGGERVTIRLSFYRVDILVKEVLRLRCRSGRG